MAKKRAPSAASATAWSADHGAGDAAGEATAELVRHVALSLPQAVELETWGEATFRVRHRIFAMISPAGDVVVVKATPQEQSLLLASDPETFAYAAYVGRFGWVAVRLASVEPATLRALLTDAWRRTAPRRVAAAFDAGR
jgi:hypothetical protein